MDALKNYDQWKLATPWDDEPEIMECELCGCENHPDAFRELKMANSFIMVCDSCNDVESKENDYEE